MTGWETTGAVLVVWFGAAWAGCFVLGWLANPRRARVRQAGRREDLMIERAREILWKADR